MTEFQKQAYIEMKSIDRILLWAAKAQELMDFSNILTKEDVRGIKCMCEMMEEG